MPLSLNDSHQKKDLLSFLIHLQQPLHQYPNLTAPMLTTHYPSHTHEHDQHHLHHHHFQVLLLLTDPHQKKSLQRSQNNLQFLLHQYLALIESNLRHPIDICEHDRQKLHQHHCFLLLLLCDSHQKKDLQRHLNRHQEPRHQYPNLIAPN